VKPGRCDRSARGRARLERVKSWTRSLGTAALGIGLLAATLPPASAADVLGVVTYDGAPPPEIPITPLNNDPTCGPLHHGMPTTHFYKVGAHGELGDVVVALEGVKAGSTGRTAKPLVIDQKGCEYHPYISACQTGQEIIIRNSDPVLHNVHVTPTNPANPAFDQAQMPRAADLSLKFRAPEAFVRFKCDVHPWMFAYVSVFDHPYFAVTGPDGHYRIRNVPPGHYTVVAMHRKAGTLKKAVVVSLSDEHVDFTFEPKGGT
jgi:plastocyanin